MSTKYSDIILTSQYDFLENNPHLGSNIILLGVGGSYSYGTNIDTKEHTSDIDIRGIALNTKQEILCTEDFEQVADSTTDTCIYSFNKFINLASKCNPNIIELLGLREEEYIFKNKIASEIIDNTNIFLSRQAAVSFGGYATSQLRRIENFLASSSYANHKREEHIFNSMKNMLASTIDRYTPIKCTNKEGIIEKMSLSKNVKNSVQSVNKNFKNIFRKIDAENEMKLYIDESPNPDLDVEIFADFDLKHFPLRHFFDINQDLSNIIVQYDKLGKRNTKKDEISLNKHAMHLIRLYYTAFDILENEKIITYREKEHDLLMDIRNGKFMKDGLFVEEFFELVNDLEKRLQYDIKNTSLPANPDMNKIKELKMSINERIIKEEIKKEKNAEVYVR